MHITKSTLIGTAISLIVILGLIVSTTYFGEENVRLLIESAGMWGPFTLIVLKALTIIIAPISGLPLYLLAGSLFGVTKGFIFILIGDAIGFSSAFYISRYFGKTRVEALIAKNEAGLLNTIIDRISTVRGFVVTCFVFFLVPELIAYAAGLSRLPFKYFLPILLLGDAVGSLVIVWLGHKVGISIELIFIIAVFLLLVSSLSYVISRLHTSKTKEVQ